ncbi:MAG: polysaccharide biosynthesis C-terminal domain-containing protein [Roseibium sp.]
MNPSGDSSANSSQGTSRPSTLTSVVERLVGILRGNGSDNNSAGRMALFTFVIRIGGAGLAYLSQIVLARVLGAHDYGIYSVAWMVVIILGAMACGGFSSSVNRFIPEYRQKTDFDGLRGFLRTSRQAAFVTGCLMAIVAMLVVVALRSVIDVAYIQPLLIALLALPFFAVSMVQDGIARSYDWPSLAILPTYIWRPLAILVFLISLAVAGTSLNASITAFVAVIVTLLIAVYQFGHLRQRLKPLVPQGARRVDLKTWVLISLPMLMVDGFLQLITSADVIMVSFFEDPDQVAVYFAASKTLALVHFVYFAVRAASAHRFSSYIHSDDHEGLERYVRQATLWTFWPSLAAGAGLLLIAPVLLYLFGPEFVAGYPLIALLMIGVLARASIGPADALLTMTGNQKICAVIYGITFALNVIFNLILIPRLGLSGAAIATSCAILFEAAALAIVAKRKLNITTFVLPLLFSPGKPAD